MAKLSLQNLAAGMAHTIYRNTDIIEDSHSKNLAMNDKFYSAVYKTVEKGIKQIQKYDYVIKALQEYSVQEITASCFSMPVSESKSINFATDLMFGIMSGAGWNTPEVIDEIPGEDLAEYILNGEFKKHCQSGSSFGDDALMKIINIDICNRIYTALVNGRLNSEYPPIG